MTGPIELPADLAERVRNGTMTLNDAETIAVQNDQRFTAYAASIREALKLPADPLPGVLDRMIGYPVPEALAAKLTPGERRMVEGIAARRRAHPLRIRRKRTKGWRRPEDAVIVDRTSRWGNPYEVKEFGRVEAIAMYERWLLGNTDLIAQLPDLRGKRLACFCKLNEPCHADVLARLANAEAL